MSPAAPASALAAILALAGVAACGLDPSTKRACADDADCLGGRACVDGVCRPPGPAASPSGDPVVPPPPGADGGALALCDLTAADSCGRTADGGPMVCYAASALAGEDFCAPACDPSRPPADEHVLCLDSGALLQRCHPNDSASPAADCAAGLSCYRTSLVADTGVCIRMPVCSKDADCPSAVYATCTATIVSALSPAATALLHLDHLGCVHQDCLSERSSCAGGEGCLATQYASSNTDLCVPACDPDLKCPPNYSCARATSGPGSPDLCLPGLPGARCDGDHCVIGDCEDTGAGFRVCTIPCGSDADCATLNTSTSAFVCVTGGGQSHCVTPVPFNGANCETDDQCQADRGEFCARSSLRGLSAGHGECRVPCDADGACSPQGGLPHGCLGDAGGCFPGVLGVPCTGSSECISPLSCEVVAPEPDLPGPGGPVCTAGCAPDGGNDADGDARCAGPAIQGYCGGGVCRLPRGAGLPCDRPAQCQSHLCDAATQTCLMAAANPSGL